MSKPDQLGEKPPTLYDVARLAGVSHQTVSRVITSHPNVSFAMRERVTAAVNELGYRPNQVARSLATSKSNRIGVLVYELLASGPSKIMEAASARAREAGYVLDIVSLDASNDAGISDAIDLVAQSHIAGVLAFTPSEHVISALRAAKFSVPVSLEVESDDWSSGGTHLGEAGVDLMVEHLASLGHRRFFHIGGPADSLAARGRARAYAAAIERLGLISEGSSLGDWSAQSGYDSALKLPLDTGITALVAANDQTALGVIAALASRGVRVPEDLSVVGFDDIPESQFFRPALTTVRFDFASQGRNMVDRLIARIEGRRITGGPVVDEPTVIIRESTAPPPR